MNMAFRTRTIHGTLLVLKFEFLLVLNHDDVIRTAQRSNIYERRRELLNTQFGEE